MPLEEATAEKRGKKVQAVEDRDGDGIVEAPDEGAGTGRSGGLPGDMIARATAAMEAMAEDVALASKTVSLSFDEAGFASGTGPKYEEATLADMRTALLKLDTTLDTLPVTVQTVRESGYIFDNSLEREISALNQQWDDVMPRIMDEVQRRGKELTAMSVRVGKQFPWDGTGTEPPERHNAAWELERTISSAESDIRGMYAKLEDHIQDVERRLQKAEYLMDRISEAGFKLQPNEYAVAACKARYLTGTGDDEGPQGFLFLTDQRLIFEQNEEVVLEKKLFIATKKEHVQEVKLDVPVGVITKAEAEDKGLMGHKDFLDMRFQEPPAPRPGARFHIQGSNEEWVALINKVNSGEIDTDRVGAKSMAERVAEEEAGGPPAETKPDIPTHCPGCGAPISVKIVRGMTSVTCGYCGVQIPV